MTDGPAHWRLGWEIVSCFQHSGGEWAICARASSAADDRRPVKTWVCRPHDRATAPDRSGVVSASRHIKPARNRPRPLEPEPVIRAQEV